MTGDLQNQRFLPKTYLCQRCIPKYETFEGTTTSDNIFLGTERLFPHQEFERDIRADCSKTIALAPRLYMMSDRTYRGFTVRLTAQKVRPQMRSATSKHRGSRMDRLRSCLQTWAIVCCVLSRVRRLATRMRPVT